MGNRSKTFCKRYPKVDLSRWMMVIKVSVLLSNCNVVWKMNSKSWFLLKYDSFLSFEQRSNLCLKCVFQFLQVLVLMQHEIFCDDETHLYKFGKEFKKLWQVRRRVKLLVKRSRLVILKVDFAWF